MAGAVANREDHGGRWLRGKGGWEAGGAGLWEEKEGERVRTYEGEGGERVEEGVAGYGAWEPSDGVSGCGDVACAVWWDRLGHWEGSWPLIYGGVGGGSWVTPSLWSVCVQ